MRRRAKRPSGPSGTSEPTAYLVSASVDKWLDRVRPYSATDPLTGLLTVDSRKEDLEQHDPYVAAGAKWLDQAGGIYTDGSLPACRTFWRMWARRVLIDAGLSSMQRSDFEVGLGPLGPEGVPDRPAASPPVLRELAGQLEACVEGATWCALEYAIFLEATCLRLDAATAERAGDETRLAAFAATIISQLLGDVRFEFVQPLAERGRKALQSTRLAAKVKAEAARRNSPAKGWRKEVEGRRFGSAEAVYARIERREGLRPGTVKKAVIRHRQRDSR